jgi:Domain of unknown function (DUF4157)
MTRISGLEDHLKAAQDYYGPSVDLSRVRVKGSRVVYQAEAWTCGNVIRFKNAKRAEDINRSTLIHELGHVWEHQSGQAQLLKGLVEQAGRLRGHDPYDYGGPAGAKSTKRLQDLTKESQAMVLQEYWNALHGEAADTQGNPFTTEYMDDLKRLISDAGIGTSPPRGGGPVGWIDTGVASIVNGALGIIRS